MSDILTKGGGVGGERPNLQEIPLTEGGVRGRLEDALREQERDIEAEKCAREERHERFLKELDEKTSGGSERKLKTASLKRFLGLKPKKTSEPAMELAGQGGMVDIEKQNSANEDEDDGSEATASGGSELNKRFKMRLGGLHRNAHSKDSESKIDLNSATSKATLKSSFSTYWNSVFKKKNSKSVNDMEHASDTIRITNFLETKDQGRRTLAEDIHALKISEDPN